MFSKLNKVLLTAICVSGVTAVLSTNAQAASNTASSAATFKVNTTIEKKPNGVMGSNYPTIKSDTSRALQMSPRLSIADRMNCVPDLSEWQGSFTESQVKALKNEVPFVILRVQYGNAYYDKTFAHNKALVEKYNIPYGVYSFSQYTDPTDAAYEAKVLYNRAPNAAFYVNDYEDQTVTSGGTNQSAVSWYNTMKGLAGNRKVLLYSYASFMNSYASTAVKNYDGFWLAAYQSYEPTTAPHVLWQYTNSHYLSSIGKNVDANISTNKDSSWFLGNQDNSSNVTDSTNTPAPDTTDNTSTTAPVDNTKPDSGLVTNITPKPLTSYKKMSGKFVVKSVPGHNFYNHIPKNGVYSYRVSAYANYYRGLTVTVDNKGVRNATGAVYYRCYYNGKKIGWIYSKALANSISYKKTSGSATVISNPGSSFYNHVTNSNYNVKKTFSGNSYAGKTLTFNSVGTKDGWDTPYYRCYDNGKLIGWIYGKSLKIN